jgi:8-amino-7-oxononanoate synthase
LGTIPALVGKDDVVVLDKLVHASIIDAARLSGATLRVFKHNDLDDLLSILKWADSRHTASETGARRPRVLVVTESVFSMDGDLAPLREIVELKDRHGAWLMVDEAHGTGLFGANRRGVAELCGVTNSIEVQMGTLGKAIGAAGGYICGSRKLIDLLMNRARSFVFSTAPPPAQSAAAAAGVQIVQSDEGAERCAATWARTRELHEALKPARKGQSPQSAIVPILIGPEDEAMKRAADLRARGFFVPAIRFPTVSRGAARLRVTLTGSHTAADVAQLGEALTAKSIHG